MSRLSSIFGKTYSELSGYCHHRLLYRYLYPTDVYKRQVAYLSQQQDTTLVFLQEGLPYLSRYCDIFVSDALKSINEPMAMHVSVGIGMSNDLLQIDIASVDVTADELYDILRAYRKRRKYYRLMDGRLLSLEGKELEETNALLDDLAIDLKDVYKRQPVCCSMMGLSSVPYDYDLYLGMIGMHGRCV